MTICIRQFPCSLCYIELSSLYLKVANRHENNINFNISLKKNTTTVKFANGLPVAVFYAMLLANKIFSNRKYFFSPIYKLLKKMVYLEVVNSKQNTSGWKIFFREYHCLEYRDRYVVC